MSRRECIGVPDETVQHNDGKWGNSEGVEKQRSDTREGHKELHCVFMDLEKA